jgi:hypothetical protein
MSPGTTGGASNTTGDGTTGTGTGTTPSAAGDAKQLRRRNSRGSQQHRYEDRAWRGPEGHQRAVKEEAPISRGFFTHSSLEM